MIGTPKLVLPVSATASGASFSPLFGCVPITTTGSVSLPPAADLIVTLAGGCDRSATLRRCKVPVFVSRPKPWATMSGTTTSSDEVASISRL
ncbi:hypothetical protein D3C84_596190 [compost metagenome]